MVPIEFLDDPTHANVRILCWIWVGLFGLLLAQQWQSRKALGLPLAYALGMTLIHLGGGFAYAFDHYAPRSAYLAQGANSLKFTHAGFWMSTMGFGSFVLGVTLSGLVFGKDPDRKPPPTDPQVNEKLPGTLLLLSLLFYFFINPITHPIPSVGALGTGGTYFSIIAIFLFCYFAYERGASLRFKQWLASTIGFPLLTVLTTGFMSYGTSAAIAVWMLVLRFFKPRWISITVIVALVTFGLTAFVNWMAYRDIIRRQVWGGESMSQRVDSVMAMVKDLQIFSPYKPGHLEWLDVRMNQNDFVGKAMAYTGFVEPFAEGQTLWVAITAWIPRMLWPGKPVLGGSGNLVTTYTGQKLSETSSFGVGQVLEFYVNFGAKSVFLGMLILGLVLGFLDRRAAFHFHNRDFWNMTRWMLPAIGMIQPNGALGEVVSAAAANAVLVVIFHQAIFIKYYHPNAIAPVQSPTRRGSKVPR
jgi:hypothetical protein